IREPIQRLEEREVPDRHRRAGKEARVRVGDDWQTTRAVECFEEVGAGDLEGVNLSPQPPPRSGEGELRSPTVASAWWRTLGAWRARPEASHPSPKRGGAGGEVHRLNGPARGLRLHGDVGAQRRVVGETGVGGSVLRIADSGAHADGEIGGGDRRTAG